MADFSEVWGGIRAVLVADGTLTALLGSATEIYYDKPPIKPTFPAILILLVDDGSQVDMDAYGRFLPRFQFDIFATKESTITAILEEMDRLIEIPKRRLTTIDLTNWILTQLTRRSNVSIGQTLYSTSEGIPIRQRSIEYVGKAVRKTF